MRTRNKWNKEYGGGKVEKKVEYGRERGVLFMLSLGNSWWLEWRGEEVLGGMVRKGGKDNVINFLGLKC